jgi:hypothetical protein
MNCETYKFSEFDEQRYQSTSVRPCSAEATRRRSATSVE